MYGLIVFDLDGTLIESRRDLADAASALVEHYGGRPLDVEAVTAMVGEGADVLIRKAFAASGAGEVPGDAFPRFLEIYHRLMLRHTHPYDGVREMLELLDGRFEMAVLSNKPRVSCTIILEELGLARYFRTIAGGDGPWPKKPDPAGLLALKDQAQPPGGALLVGDSHVDLMTARAAGTGICMARWGFGYARVGAGMLRGDEWLADHPRDLLALLGAGGDGY